MEKSKKESNEIIDSTKIKLPFNEFGYIANISQIMLFINTNKKGDIIYIYNLTVNKDKLGQYLYHHTYIWDNEKKKYIAEETNEKKINFLINKITISSECRKNSGCHYYINFINHENPIMDEDKFNIQISTSELIKNDIQRKKIPEGTYETENTKSGFIESVSNGNEVKLNFEIENDINNEDIKTLNYFFGDVEGKNNFKFYWDDQKKIYKSKNNLCILLIFFNNGKFLLSSTVLNGIVKNFNKVEIKKSYEKIKFDKNGNYKIKFKFQDASNIFLFKSEDNGFNLIFKNTFFESGSRFFLWNTNKKVYTNDKYTLTFYKIENNVIKAKFNNIKDKSIKFDYGSIHESFESEVLKDGFYINPKKQSQSILIKDGKFKARILNVNDKDTFYYNSVLKGYSTKNKNSDIFIIFKKVKNQFQMFRYHYKKNSEEPINLDKNKIISDDIDLFEIPLVSIIAILILLTGVYLIYLKISNGYLEIQLGNFNLII